MSMSDQSQGYRHPFVFGVHYLGGIGDFPRTLTELAMCKCSAELRRRPDWWNMFRDPVIREEWAERAQKRLWRIHLATTYRDTCLSVKQVNYLLDELEGYAALRDPENRCQVSCFERIWESTSFPSPSVLNSELSLLRPAPSTPSGEEAVYLIDPYLHPLVYNKTLVAFPRNQSLRTIPPPTCGAKYTISQHSAFLPANISISSSGTATFTSYINNLHPKQRASLYAELEATFTAFVPLFEHTLTDLHRNNTMVQRIPGTCRYIVWDEPEEPEYSDDEEGWAAYASELRHWLMNRPIRLPDVPEDGYPGGLEERKHIVSLRGRAVQAVVDVSEVQLEPEGPSYSGSPWHVEGMRNERIVACAHYFTSVENITSTSLEFRMAVTYPRGFMAGDTGATLRTWGLRDGDACHQYIGSRPIQPGLAIVFPNIYQHCQTPFALLDPSKPGHQTVVSFYLIDPEIQPVVSTADVAPQQREWIRDALDGDMDRRVPVEVMEKIVEEVEGVMEMGEAEEYARELRKVRERFRELNDACHFCIPFDIWRAPDFTHG